MSIAIYSEVLFAVAAATYTALLSLLFTSANANTTRNLLASACAVTGIAGASFAADWVNVLGPSGAFAEVAL
ncbi:MAG: hypothetical protein JO356_03885, partial [Acidobacteria bacterium]|nr:hypothetical protein [Acidobacteriota bacterium]